MSPPPCISHQNSLKYTFKKENLYFRQFKSKNSHFRVFDSESNLFEPIYYIPDNQDPIFAGYGYNLQIFNRPGVAGAVLQTP